LSGTFCFYRYKVEAVIHTDTTSGNHGRFLELFGLGVWDGLLSDLTEAEKKDLRRMVFLSAPYFYSARSIPGLDPSTLPRVLCDGSGTRGDTLSCTEAQVHDTHVSRTYGRRCDEN
jgi:hypothetical protein